MASVQRVCARWFVRGAPLILKRVLIVATTATTTMICVVCIVLLVHDVGRSRARSLTSRFLAQPPVATMF
jgi:hypothetical protein